MFIFGWGFKTIKRYGILGQGTCNICSNESKWQLIKITTWFTLFFIPIFPTNIKRMVICTNCNSGKEIDKETFNNIRNSLKSNHTTKESQEYDTSEVTKYVTKTETQKNYLREMEQLKKEQEERMKTASEKSKEEKIIEITDKPYTKDILCEEIRSLGIKEGMTVLVHSSLSSIGWVCGREISVIQALMEVLTEEGTLIMPTHSGEYSDPVLWENPPVPKDWINIIKGNMPAFDKNTTATRGIGVIPEAFRKFSGVVRSNHPHVSFAAWGKYKNEIVSNHSLEFGLGENSPLKKIYNFNGHILLLGVDYNSNTSFHLAEYLYDKGKTIIQGAPLLIEGKREWVEFQDIELDSSDFEKIGNDLEKEVNISIGKIGKAESRLLNQKDAVDYAIKWMKNNRKIDNADIY